MIYKVCSFPGTDPHSGERLISVVRPEDSETFLKTAQALHPKIQKYVAALKPDPQKVYVMVIALGASEYYGQNINGDIFPEAALLHEGEDYGYRTFLNGHAFRHHQNKDPNAAFGMIPVSIWNNEMKRVELILELDRNKAQQFDAQDIIDKIEAGVSVSVSMGCKVPYDICTICHNKAKVRAEYCYHLLNEMGTIYPDGRQVGAVNTMPRFFDLSFVFIGADKIAKTVCKIASGGCCPACQASADGVKKSVAAIVESGDAPELQLKTAAVAPFMWNPKTAATKKLSDIFKNTPSTFVRSTVPLLERSEPNLPRKILDHMGTQGPLGDALATPSLMGMVLKPSEYQRIILIRLGQKPLADRLESHGEVFGPSGKVDESVSMGQFSPDLCSRLTPHLKERSGFGPILQKRVLQILIVRPKVAEAQEISKRGLLEKISQGYNGYRLQLLSHLPHELPKVLENNADLAAELFHDRFVEVFSKEAAGIGTNLIPVKPLLGLFPILYFLSAHWKSQEMNGRRLGFVKKFVAERPELSSLLAAGVWAQAAARNAALV